MLWVSSWEESYGISSLHIQIKIRRERNE
jgi:hypothetical protein